MADRDPRYPVPHDESMLPVFRALTVCAQRVERLLDRFTESHGLTPSQFDVLATLGDGSGMTFKELSEQSLVTGGTLTPVLGRLEAKGLVSRCKGPQDARQTIVSLTADGQAAYERTFLPFVDHARAHLEVLSEAEQAQLAKLLNKLAGALG